MEQICGIYKITNKINSKCYIGKSKNIYERWKYHKRTPEQNKTLYLAFNKYGIDNFDFEILEYIDNDLYDSVSNEKEKYWIEYYNSFHNGYNMTKGGDGGTTINDPREKFGKLTEEEVIYLRKRYIECKYPGTYIWEKEFKNRITIRGFGAIWRGQVSKNIMPEVFTKENKDKQLKLGRKYEGMLKRRFSLEEKQKIKNRIINGEHLKTIWKEYSSIYSYSGFRDCINHTSLDEEIDMRKEKLDELKE